MKLCFFEGKQRNIFVYNLFICEYMECDNLINQKMFHVQFMFEIKKKILWIQEETDYVLTVELLNIFFVIKFKLNSFLLLFMVKKLQKHFLQNNFIELWFLLFYLRFFIKFLF